MEITQTFAIEAQKKLGGGDASTAVRMLEEGIRLYPDYTTAYAVLARAYMQMNDTESAFETVQQGLRRFPSHRALLMLHADLRPHALSTHHVSQRTAEKNHALQPVDRQTIQHQTEQTSNENETQRNAPPDLDVESSSKPTVDRIQRETPQQGVIAAPRSEQQIPKPEIDDTDVKLDDGLSNIDDDNDNWPELIELVDEDAEDPESDEDGEDVRESRSSREDDASLLTVDTNIVLKNMNVVDGSVVVNNSLLKRIRLGADALQLRLVATTETGKGRQRTLKSSNMRLIPGLEFTPLRVQSLRRQHVRTHNLQDPPAFPVIRGSDMNVSPAIAPSPNKESTKRKKESDKKARNPETKRTHLEELAARLEQARIPVITEEPEVGTKNAIIDTSEPTLVSETMAGIYEQQGLKEQAIKAYRQLARQKPEKLSFFEQKIAALMHSSES